MSDDTQPTNRRERRKLAMRDRILAAAEALFDERGFDETKVAEICDRADIAYGTFFGHFPTKQDLVRALAEEAVEGTAVVLEAASGQPGSFEDHLRTLFEGSAVAARRSSPGRRDLMGRMLLFTDAAAERDRNFHASVEAFVRREIERGNLPADTPVESAAEVIVGTNLQQMLSFIYTDDYPFLERAQEAAVFVSKALTENHASREGA